MNDEPHSPTADARLVWIWGSDWQDYTQGGLAALVPAAKAAYR